MGNGSPAVTAEDIQKKYRYVRFTSSTAGKSQIYSLLYFHLTHPGGEPDDTSWRDPLYEDMGAIRSMVETEEDGRLYNQYMQLKLWMISAYEAAGFMRNAVTSSAAHLQTMVLTAISGENLRKGLDGKAVGNNAELWLSLLSADSLRPTLKNYEAAVKIRRDIRTGLRYLKVYDTLMKLIAEETRIPEITAFQPEMESLERSLGRLNESMGLLKKHILERETVPDQEAVKGFSSRLTDSAKQAMLDVMKPISVEAGPIPQINVKATQRFIRNYILMGNHSWSGLFPVLSYGYYKELCD